MRASRFWLAFGVAAALLALTLVARSLNLSTPRAGDERADLSQTFPDMHGQDVRLADYAGKPLVINLWATWCAPCRLEMPQLVDLAARYQDRGLTILGISVDDTPEDIRAFAKEFGVNYPLLVGLGKEDALASLGYFGGVPMSIFIRADGVVVHRLTGIATTEAWERRIESLF
jgi:thiol-disulfide isomerase/thioredoxin